MDLNTISENKCFGGIQGVYTHTSTLCQCDMTFGLFLPPQAEHGPVPLLWYLSGLTCTHENAMVKAGAQAFAAQHGIAVVFPDTSPRGPDIVDHADYDLGQGAGFYVDATQGPWNPHFMMRSYILNELPSILQAHFPLAADRNGITGHSMGGHGALTLAMSEPGRFASVSAFAPIANPVNSSWGQKQFEAYLGTDQSVWNAHDATVLMAERGLNCEVLIDQGASDQFLNLLMPEALSQAMAARRQPGTFRMQAGYDHSYFFVATFMAEHIAFHAETLNGPKGISRSA